MDKITSAELRWGATHIAELIKQPIKTVITEAEIRDAMRAQLKALNGWADALDEIEFQKRERQRVQTEFDYLKEEVIKLRAEAVLLNETKEKEKTNAKD